MRISARWSLVAAALIGLSLTGCAPKGCSSAGYGDNLIQNPGAESGEGSKDGTVVIVPSWKTTAGKFTAVLYGSPDFLAAKDPGPPDRGKSFFAGGPDAPQSAATQTITLAVPAADIDSGHVQYMLSGWLGGYSGQNDNVTVTAKFLGQSGTAIGSAAIGPVMAADRHSATALVERTVSGQLPSGARIVEVTMTMVRTDGAYNDGYADNLSFTLKK